MSFRQKKEQLVKKGKRKLFLTTMKKVAVSIVLCMTYTHTKKNITKIIKTTKAITFSISLRFRNLSLFIHSGGLMSHLNSCYRNVPPWNTYPLYFVNTFQSFFWGIVSNCITKWVCKKKKTIQTMGEALFSLTFNACYVTWWTHFGENMEEHLTISLHLTSRNHNNTTVWPFSRGAIFKGASVICSLYYPWSNSTRKNKGLVEVYTLNYF